MPVTTVNPTANQTPDAGQGGSAVTGASNTGHSSTTSNASSEEFQSKTCRWSAFQSVPGAITKIVLKFNWSASAFVQATAPNINDVGIAQGTFTIAYSVNGGSSWTQVVNLIASANAVGPDGDDSDSFDASNTESINLPVVALDQIQVRDNIQASTDIDNGGTASASVTGTVGNTTGIQLEVTTQSGQVIVLM